MENFRGMHNKFIGNFSNDLKSGVTNHETGPL
jgi:hypothetical protein